MSRSRISGTETATLPWPYAGLSAARTCRKSDSCPSSGRNPGSCRIAPGTGAGVARSGRQGSPFGQQVGPQSAAAASGGEIGQPLTSAAGRRRQRVSSSLVNSSPGSSMCRGRGPRHRLDLTHRLGRHMPVLRRSGQCPLADALTSSDCAPAGSYCGVGVRGAAPVLRCGAVGGVRDV